MNPATVAVLALAERHVNEGPMASSARVCLNDALSLFVAGDIFHAEKRALRSLAYSVGIFHSDYSLAVDIIARDANAEPVAVAS